MLVLRLCALIATATVVALLASGPAVHAVEMPLPPALRKVALTEAEGVLARNEGCLAPGAMRDLTRMSAEHAAAVGGFVAEVLRARRWGSAAADCRCLQNIATGTVAVRPDAAAGVQAVLGHTFPECALALEQAMAAALTHAPVPAAAGARPGQAVAAAVCADAATCLAVEPPHADVTARTQLR